MESALQNVLAPAVPITLGGRELKLVFDFNAVALVEEQTGRNLLDESGWLKINGSALSIILWAAALKEQPELTLKDVRGLMRGNQVPLVSQKVLEAWTLSKPKPEEKPEDPTSAAPETTAAL
jgi:hypothetical protein